MQGQRNWYVTMTMDINTFPLCTKYTNLDDVLYVRLCRDEGQSFHLEMSCLSILCYVKTVQAVQLCKYYLHVTVTWLSSIPWYW